MNPASPTILYGLLFTSLPISRVVSGRVSGLRIRIRYLSQDLVAPIGEWRHMVLHLSTSQVSDLVPYHTLPTEITVGGD